MLKALVRAPHKQSGFTLIELMVIISIIGLLSAVIFLSLNEARVKAKNGKRLAEKSHVATAFSLYRLANNGEVPDSGGTWHCIAPSAESCWRGTYSGLDSLVTALTPYLPTLPNNDAYSGEYAHNRIIYTSNITIGGRTGAFIVWPQEGVMAPEFCQSTFPVQVLDRYSYCYEFLGT